MKWLTTYLTYVTYLTFTLGVLNIPEGVSRRPGMLAELALVFTDT